MLVTLDFLASLKPALDVLPEAVTFVRVWTDSGQMLSFAWVDDSWQLRPPDK